MHSVQCTLYNVEYMEYTGHWTMCSIWSILDTVHCIIYNSVWSIVYTGQWTMDSGQWQCLMCILQCKRLYAVYTVYYTVYSVPYI